MSARLSTRVVVVAAQLVALAIAWPAQAQVVTRGPYLQRGTPTSIVIRWRTDQATDSRVSHGIAPGNLADTSDDSVVTTEHEVELTGLTPGTPYYYAVGTTGQALAGDDADHFFVTSPLAGTAMPLRVWVLGDSGKRNDDARAVRDAYLGFNGPAYTDTWLMLGDNAYNDGTDSEYQQAVFDMYPTVLRQTVLWSTLGNHDDGNSDTQTGTYYDVFTLPKAAEAGGLASGTEAYYSFDFANIHFVCLDSHDTDNSPNGAMMTWLENDLAATTRTWIIASCWRRAGRLPSRTRAGW